AQFPDADAAPGRGTFGGLGPRRGAAGIARADRGPARLTRAAGPRARMRAALHRAHRERITLALRGATHGATVAQEMLPGRVIQPRTGCPAEPGSWPPTATSGLVRAPGQPSSPGLNRVRGQAPSLDLALGLGD